MAVRLRLIKPPVSPDGTSSSPASRSTPPTSRYFKMKGSPRKPSALSTSSGNQDEPDGFTGHIDPEELERLNFRMLSNRTLEKKHVLLPAVLPLSALCIRGIFTKLCAENEKHEAVANAQGGILGEESVPTVFFARAMDRLYELVDEKDEFNIADLDKNDNGVVSWGECFHFCKRGGHLVIRLSICERIYLTFDNPDSSLLAQFISIFVLMTIATSSSCFVLRTLPQFNVQDPPFSEPRPAIFFDYIEDICQVLFVAEYVIRILTVWAVRDDIFNEQRIVELVTSFDPIPRTSCVYRLFRFITTPANLVDLAAILPGLLGAFISNGEGFVVLRLIRLARVFRAFKSPALSEPVTLLARTIEQSTKALYILIFMILLGIVIFGSLMYLVEGMTAWNEDAQVFERQAGIEWNSAEESWDPVFEPSPFSSIPDSFWWSLVTALTVGYGDENHYPKTPTGKAVAYLNMLFSLAILTLPVGVIGSTFAQVWYIYKIECQEAITLKRDQLRYITSAIQRLEPSRLSSVLLFEVWHDKDGQEGVTSRPHDSRFMGEAKLQLTLPPQREVQRTVKLRLENNDELGVRTITGALTVQYVWEPDPKGVHDESRFLLHGRLSVTICHADKLVNLDYTSLRGASSPYVTVFSYPQSPTEGHLRPCVWRTETVKLDCNPRWDATKTFQIDWDVPHEMEDWMPALAHGEMLESDLNPASCSDNPACEDGEPSKLTCVARLIEDVARGICELREDVRSLTDRIDRKDGSRGSASTGTDVACDAPPPFDIPGTPATANGGRTAIGSGSSLLHGARDDPETKSTGTLK
mmetsp:Transcript_71621/g.142131  ORF Transcript_71621/g.142131 Transcript_71621/m.142131 type:complete len:811 (-) Transcript_71621:47-2479(-)